MHGPQNVKFVHFVGLDLRISSLYWTGYYFLSCSFSCTDVTDL